MQDFFIRASEKMELPLIEIGKKWKFKSRCGTGEPLLSRWEVKQHMFMLVESYPRVETAKVQKAGDISKLSLDSVRRVVILDKRSSCSR